MKYTEITIVPRELVDKAKKITKSNYETLSFSDSDEDVAIKTDELVYMLEDLIDSYENETDELIDEIARLNDVIKGDEF